jgi:AcrR family transcriptional regulator
MPKETFFNLSSEKREKIIDAAMDEFASRSYFDARITAITDQASIARGSFYQYFEDKKDLFKYIIDLAVNQKIQYINQTVLVNMEKCSFFQILREAYLSGIRFAKEHPRLLAIGLQLVNNQELYQEILGEQAEKSYAFYQRLVEKGINDGELDPTIDPVVVSRFLTRLNYALADLVYEDGKLDMADMTTIDQLLSFVENGLRKRE